jgi:hypothetical protein
MTIMRSTRPAIPTTLLVLLAATGCTAPDDAPRSSAPESAGWPTPDAPTSAPSDATTTPRVEIDYEAFTKDLDGLAFGAGSAASGYFEGGTYEIGIICAGATGKESISASHFRAIEVGGEAEGAPLHELEGACAKSPVPQTTRTIVDLEPSAYYIESTASDGVSAAVRLARHKP